MVEALANHQSLLTVKELADLLTISPKTLYARAKAGSIPTVHFFGSLRFDPMIIAGWLEERVA
jgi:excisionase family DNA binding protein